MMDEIAAAASPDRSLEDQVDRALDACIDNVTGHAALYKSFVRELPALGQAVAERQLAVIERFAALLVELVASGRRARPDLAARARNGHRDHDRWGPARARRDLAPAGTRCARAAGERRRHGQSDPAGSPAVEVKRLHAAH
jgi:hypothetical protein